jgi:2-polyprenyl-3-methyl-5-hydroxy-6-metoxy-1,4-benzoquinol methylase
MPPSPDVGPRFVARVTHRFPYGRRGVGWLRRLRQRYWPGTESVTRSNTLEAYERVYGSDRLLAEYLDPARLKFYEEVATTCARLEPRRVIDVGCGTGNLLRFLVDRLSTSPELVVGVDHASAGIDRARERLPTASWFVGDLYTLSPTLDRFDLVLCTEVLEHLEEPARAVEMLRRLCASGGHVAITVPDGAQDSWEGHVNFWDEDQLRAFLAPHGLVDLVRIEDGRAFLAWLAHDEQPAR